MSFWFRSLFLSALSIVRRIVLSILVLSFWIIIILDKGARGNIFSVQRIAYRFLRSLPSFALWASEDRAFGRNDRKTGFPHLRHLKTCAGMTTQTHAMKIPPAQVRGLILRTMKRVGLSYTIRSLVGVLPK